MNICKEHSPRIGSTGFDILRLALAILILWSHSSWIQLLVPLDPDRQNLTAIPIPPQGFRPLFRTTTAMAVPMFFVLSGYLVAGSAERLKDLRTFLIHRLLRILPALIVEVTLSAIVIGCVFTNLPLRTYLTQPSFYQYFLNIFGIVHFYLPGVFEDNVLPRYVNINLWTLPAEFYCFLLMSFCVLVNFCKYRHIVLYITICIHGAFVAANLMGDIPVTSGENFTIAFTVLFFFIGLCFYLYRDEIVMKEWVFLCALGLGFGLLSHSQTLALSPAPLGYATVYIGTRKLYLPALLKKNDYSYGIYLYGFPIAQSLSAAFPQLREMRYSFRFAAIGVTVMFAALSWHLVERRFLLLKARLERRSAGPLLAAVPELEAARPRDRLPDAPIAPERIGVRSLRTR